jgi:hydroxyacylglutathione hydrolase
MRGVRSTSDRPGGYRVTSVGAAALTGFAALVAAGCARPLPALLEAPPHAYTVTTGGPNQSMIHLARVEGGVIVVDLGWWGAEEALEEGLAALGAGAGDVVAVFITHAHRDHLGGWRLVRHAPFHVSEAEAELLFGREEHGGWVPRVADRLVEADVPRPGEVEVRTFGSDTAIAFGGDTLHAFLVPGHTAGSAAYLFRGVLFAGDAVSYTPTSGFRPALAAYSDDVEEAKESLRALRDRLDPYEVRWVCTAHARCAEATTGFWDEVLR